MDIHLPTDLEAFVTRKVASGFYRTPSEVVREGLLLLRERDALVTKRLEELRQELILGIEQANRGETAPFDARETLARVRQERDRRTGNP